MQNSFFTPQPQMFTAAEAAAYLNVSVRTIDRYVKNGIIKPTKVGHLVRFKKEDLDTPQSLSSPNAR